ncbi:hypothetical protein [uncultured Thiohalocapsa sp.]|uniref:hypothetical protein n=1 Tax=uncultured Thiohalocapsa sp. TaxID=768990 RepID=UPI0025D081DE|nr:hypothetical protein [uncultured Thiohalocapsa sp.]
MTKPLASTLLAGALLATAGVATATESVDLALEPCMNGEVSADGTLPTRALAELRAAYERLAKPTEQPFYTFMVAGRVVVQEP